MKYIKNDLIEADLLNNLGNLLFNLGKSDEAKEQFEKAIASDPDHVEALNNLGYVPRRENRCDRGRGGGGRRERPFEALPPARERAEPGADVLRTPVAGEAIGTERIDGDEQEVRGCGLRRCAAAEGRHAAGAEKEGETRLEHGGRGYRRPDVASSALC